MSSLGSPTDRPPMAKPSKPISDRPASDSSRKVSCMPPWTMPNSALGFSRRSNSSRERFAQRSDSRIDAAAASNVAG